MSCDILGLNPVPGVGGGNALWLDNKGHAQVEVTYDTGTFTETLRADGTYERKWFHYDSVAHRNVQYDGDSGTYTYDATSLQLVLTLENFFDFSTATMLPYSSGVTFTYSAPVLLLDHSSPVVFIKTGKTWIRQESYNYVDSLNPANNFATSYAHAKTYSTGTGGYTYAYRVLSSKGGNPTYVSAKTDKIGDVTVFPEGAIITAGATVTFNIALTGHTYQTWDTTAGTLTPVAQGSLGYGQDTLYSKDGKYFIDYPADATRNVIERDPGHVTPVPAGVRVP